MIDERSRSREWILESCKQNKVNDPTLMEKTIRAFSLLEALARSGCPFLFKGSGSGGQELLYTLSAQYIPSKIVTYV